MTFLSAAQSAAVRLNKGKPQAFFSSTDPFAAEIIELANDLIQDILKSTDWRALTKLYSMAGDGVTTSFSLPDDYDRMPLGVDVNSGEWYPWGYNQAPDLNLWQQLIDGFPVITPGYWIMLNGSMQFQPAPPAGKSAQFYYISKDIVIGQNEAPKDAFTADDDTFLLNERLLSLGLIWRWRSMKRLEYSEDMASYEKALSEIMAADKGATVIRDNGRRWNNRTRNVAYPWPLGGL